MLAIDLSRAKRQLTAAWLVFATVMAWLMFYVPGEETIPYHLIWASFALLYGLYPWSKATTWIVFWSITVVTGIPLIAHAESRIIGWEECSEIVLMGVLVALLIWHVNRQRLAQLHLNELREIERIRADHREVAARFGSHEVRTRLTIARGFAEMIRDRASDETTRGDASLVLSELDKASVMATQLLTLVRVETPSVVFPIELPVVVAQILLRWAGTADRQWRSDVNVARIHGDVERFEAAIDCLIENAVKFTEVGDSITVSVRAEREAILISVTDTGCGIPAEDLQRVAQIFQTGRSAGDRAGSGLGLAIVRAIVESRGGSLEIHSVEGEGTRITMRTAVLPVTSPTRQGAFASDLPIDELAGGPRLVGPAMELDALPAS